MSELKWYGDKISSGIFNAVKQAVNTCAADLQSKSVKQAPIDTGDLRSNCSVSLTSSINNVSATVGYDLPYAIVQHERLDFNHPKGGKAKYLEDPYNENKNSYADYIKNAVKKGL